LVCTKKFIDELEQNTEPTTDSEPMPKEIKSVEFDDVCFSCENQQEAVLSGVSFEFRQDEFIRFVGQSGVGKLTIVSLLVRMHEPDTGEIRADNRPIHEMDINEWRSQIAVVRQNQFIFNDTLRYDMTIGNWDVSKEKLDRVVRIAKIDEFFDEPPDDHETQLGDDGVRLSGGQR
jgi:subfamily B ATP-binding cassette protein MsbA